MEWVDISEIRLKAESFKSGNEVSGSVTNKHFGSSSDSQLCSKSVSWSKFTTFFSRLAMLTEELTL